MIETDPAPHVRIAALEALGALGGEQAVELLASFVSAEESGKGHVIIVAVGKHSAVSSQSIDSRLIV